MSVGQESELSDEGLSVGSESKDKATINLLPDEMDTGEETSVQSSPKLADSDQTKTVKSSFHKNTSIPTNLELKGKVEANNVYTKVCEVTTKATKISTNDLLEIKVQRQSILPESYPSDNPKDNVFSENKTQIVTHTKESHFELDILAFHANEQSLGANYSRDCITEHKNHICSQGSNERLNNGLTMTVECTKVIPSPTEEVEALDLSLPKNPIRNSKQNQWVDDTEHEGSLYMEVDEIKDDQQLVEVEQEDDSDNSWFSSLGEVHPYLPQHWERYLTSPSLNQAMPTTPDTKTVSPTQTDALLIDEQGVPYTLTLDGEKVLQTDDLLTEQQEALCLKQDEGHLLCSSTDSKSQPQHNSPSPNASPCAVSLETSPIAESKVSPIAESKMSSNSVALAKQSTLPAVPDMATVPIQIMASPTGSTTPILLLPQSQLQTLSPQASNANPGLLTLSLPIPLCQNSQSPSVLFVLSSPQVSSTPSLPLTGQVSQISSTSTVALPLASCSVEMGSTPSGSPIVSLGKVSSVSSTYISGLTNPSNVPACPTSSTASSSTSTQTSTNPSKQSSTDAYSNTLVPTSFREALLRLAVSVEKKNESKLETIALSVPSTEPDSSTTKLEKKEPETNCDQSLENSTASINADQTDEVNALNNQPSSTSRPQSPNQESQFLCPRRILYCQYCPRVFYYLSDLERHSITHSQSKPHVCHNCGKAFKRSSHLERHKHIHTGQRNFVCQLCPRRFRESGELMRHQRVHTGEKPFQCSICHMRFAERNTLRRHTKRKHQGQPLDTADVKVKSESSGHSFDSIQGEQEENAEWYCSTVPEMEFGSDSEDEEQLQENNGCK